MRLNRVAAAIFGSVFLSIPAVQADDNTRDLVDKVLSAYGGEALISLRSIEFEDRTQRTRFGQSASPHEIDLTFYRANIVIDFENNRKSWRSAAWFGPERYTQNQIFDGQTGYSVDHTARRFSKSAALSFARADRNLSYTLDTVLARMLAENSESVVAQDGITIDGIQHHQLSFRAEGHPEMTLAIHPATGLISQMTRPHWAPGAVFSYRFSQHTEVENITFAANTYVQNRGQPMTVTATRAVRLNTASEELFSVPGDYDQEGEDLDFSAMQIEQISERTYLAGQDWGFSLFVDMGDYLVAAGGYIDFKDRLAAVQATMETPKPVRYFVVSHHHADHMGGIQEIADMGADFVVHSDHVAALRQRVSYELPDTRLHIVEGNGEHVADGIRLIDVPSAHSTHNLATYVEEERLIFSADLFFSRQKTGGVRGSKALLDTLQEQELHPDVFAAAHSLRRLTYKDLTQAVLEETADRCPDDWQICSYW